MIDWNGEPVEARYVRLRKLQSKKSNWAAFRKFRVNPVTAQNVGLEIIADNIDYALLAFDNNPLTTYALDGKLEFERKGDANSVVLLLDSPAENIVVEQYDSAGKLVESRKIDSAYSNVTFVPEARKVALKGKTNVFEILQK